MLCLHGSKERFYRDIYMIHHIFFNLALNKCCEISGTKGGPIFQVWGGGKKRGKTKSWGNQSLKNCEQVGHKHKNQGITTICGQY